MKVKDLKERLKNVPDDYIIVMSSDAEGNDYSPLAEADEVMYIPENSYMGMIICCEEQMEDEFPDDEFKPNAIALWPTN
jgi:hypothetical protein